LPEREDVTFPSQGELLAAWRYRGEGDAFEGPGGRACVVMAHGIGGTRDSGMEPYAEAFADAGLDVVLFDYRNFGGSTGEPRQLGIPRRHREDYRSAIDFARSLDGVDIVRIVLWGTSWSGGHAVYEAAGDEGVVAVIAQTPDLDGLRTLLEIAKYAGVGPLLRLTGEGIKDQIRALRGESPHMVPVVAPPGQIGAMTSDEAE